MKIMMAAEGHFGWTRDPWKRRFLLETTVFKGYVSFREFFL